MPVVLLSIDGTNNTGPAFQQAKAGLGEIGQAFDRTTAQAAAYESAFARASAMTAQFSGGLDQGVARLSGYEAALSRATTLADQFSGRLTIAEMALGRLNGAFDSGTGSMNTWAAGQSRAAGGVDLVTAAILRQNVAVGDSLTLQRLGSSGAFGGAAASVGGSAVGRTVTRDEATAFGRAGTVLARAGASDIGGAAGGAALAAFGPGALAGPAIVGAGVIYGAVKTTQAASDFWSAVAQSGAQSDRLQSPGQINAFGNSLLNYEATGTAPYNAVTLAQGAEVPLASQYNLAALQQAIPAIARLSAQNAAPNLNLADQIVTTLATAAGTGPNSSGQQLIGYADFASRAETLTKAQPGAIVRALPTLLGGIPGTGVDINDATALLLKMGTVNPNIQRDATSMVQLFQSTQVKPTAGAIKEASNIGLAIGPGSAALYGGELGWLQALQTASGGNANTISQILTQKNARAAYYDVFAGGGLAQTAGYGSALGAASGTGQNVYNELSRGTQQQEEQLANRLNGDFVTLGTTLNSTVTPALLLTAGALLSVVEAVPDIAKKIGGITQNVASDLHIPGGAGSLVAGLIPGGLGLNAAIMKGLFDHGGSAIVHGAGDVLGSFGNSLGNGFTNGGSITPVRPLEPWQHPSLSGVFNRGTLPNSNDTSASVGPALLNNVGATLTNAGTAFGNAASTVLTDTLRVAKFGNYLAGQIGTAGLTPTQSGTPAGLMSGISTISQAFRGVGSLNSTYGTEGSSAVVSRTLQDLQNTVAMEKLTGNPAAQANANRALLRYQTNHAGALGLDSSDLALLRAQSTTGSLGNNDVLNRQLHDLDALAQVAQLQGNAGAYNNYLNQETNLKTANASRLGLDPADLALLRAQNQTAMQLADPRVNTKPFFDTNQGLAGFQAGTESTSVRIGGAGEDPLVLENRNLRNVVSRDNAEIITLLRQLVSAGIKPNVASSGRVQR